MGVAYSLQGKGTFVSGIKLEKNFRQVQSFTEEMALLGHRPASRLLALELVPAEGGMAEGLRIPPGEEVVRLCRVRLANSIPMGIERSHCLTVSARDLSIPLTPRAHSISSFGNGTASVCVLPTKL